MRRKKIIVEINNQINKLINIKKKYCKRCGRQTRKANKCYAKTHVNGKYIDDDDNINHNFPNDWCYQCNHRHSILQCSKFQQQQQQYELDNICSRCLKTGHYRISFYETKDINNNTIEDTCIIS